MRNKYNSDYILTFRRSLMIGSVLPSPLTVEL